MDGRTVNTAASVSTTPRMHVPSTVPVTAQKQSDDKQPMSSTAAILQRSIETKENLSKVVGLDSVGSQIMELAEKGSVVGLDAKGTHTFSHIKMQDILTDMLRPHVQYPFSNPKQALECLLKAGVKPNTESLKLALTRPELSYAIQLLKAGAPTCNVYLDETKLDKSSSTTVDLFAKKKAEFCMSYYQQKLVPFFEDMFNPIFSGRAEIDFMTNFINFSFLRAWLDRDYEECLFCSSEERRANKFLMHAKEIKHKIDISYNAIKKIITNPNDSNNILKPINEFMHALTRGVFFYRFMQMLPTKRAFERYLFLITNSQKNSTCKFGDYRDSFSCLDPEDKIRYGRMFPSCRDDYVSLFVNYEPELERFETEEMPKLSKTAVVIAQARPCGY